MSDAEYVQLYRTESGGRLHLRQCPHQLGKAVVEATVSDDDICAHCRRQLRGDGRRCITWLADALPEVGAPRANPALIRQPAGSAWS